MIFLKNENICIFHFIPNFIGKIDVLLALAWSSIENDEEACSIFFDELISCINLLPKEVCIQFREIVKLQFQVGDFLQNILYLFTF